MTDRKPIKVAGWIARQGHQKYHQGSRLRNGFEDGARARIANPSRDGNTYSHAGYREAFEAGWARADEAIRDRQIFLCTECGHELGTSTHAEVDMKKKLLRCPFCRGTEFSYQERLWSSRNLLALEFGGDGHGITLPVVTNMEVLSDSNHDGCLFCLSCLRTLAVPNDIRFRFV